MSSLLIPMLQRALFAKGWTALRFNFRGVGRSEGRFENGQGEQDDVRAALTYMTSRWAGLPAAAVGWSFGSIVSLAAVAGDPTVSRFVAVAPAIGSEDVLSRYPDLQPINAEPPIERIASWQVAALALIGTQDQFATTEQVQAWAQLTLGERMRVEIMQNADHVFTGKQREASEMVAEFVAS